jgi:hypothetical protein
MANLVSAERFAKALSQLDVPGGRQLEFLQLHMEAPGKTSTATNLAAAAGYRNWNALNLQYGLLAKRIGRQLGRKRENLSLLVEFTRPKDVSNEHWLLHMRTEFAEALVSAGWIK